VDFVTPASNVKVVDRAVRDAGAGTVVAILLTLGLVTALAAAKTTNSQHFVNGAR
jgi:hypothetical protein